MRSIKWLYISAFLLCSTLGIAQGDSHWIVKDFVLEGNKKTKDWLILRECGLQKGDTIRTSELESEMESVHVNVTNLQLFASVTITPIPLPDNQLLIMISVSERWYFYPLPLIQLAEPNFNTWWKNRADSRTNYGMKFRQYNFRGRNERLALTVKFGYTREFSVRYSTPYLSKEKNWGLNLFASYKENDEIITGTIDNKRQFFSSGDSRNRVEQIYGLGISNRPDIYQKHGLSLYYQRVKLTDTVSTSFPNQLIEGKSDMNNLILRYKYGRSKVDRKGYPLKGNNLEFTATKTGLGISKNNADLLEATAQFSKYVTISDSWYTQHSISGKTSLYQELPYYSQRGLGYGNNAVRSYEFYIMDGQQYVLFRNNLKFALLPDIRVPSPELMSGAFPDIRFGLFLNLITDLGYVDDQLYHAENPLNNELLMGTGLGLDIVSNYDIVFRIEYTVNKQGENGIFLHYRKSI